MKVMIDPKHLQKGMYVAELDRPWLESPFLFQGFRITNIDELEQLDNICEYVFVDPEKSAIPVPNNLSAIPMRSKVNRVKTSIYIKPTPKFEATFEQEYPKAREMYNLSKDNVTNIFGDVRLGRSLDVAEVKYTVTSMVDSIVRHPDAMMLLATLQDKSNQAVTHAVNVCTLAITFGRFLGFEKKELTELGMGALLHDIGETKIPKEILENFSNCNTEDIKTFQDHTTFGAAILHNTKGLPDSVIAIARDHHERANGSGYPQSLSVEQLDIFTMIVAISDVYDNVTTGMYGKPPVPCTETLKNIYVWREDLFDALLVEKFIQCLGIYPVGSVVELNTGEIGIVVTNNPETRLFPKVLLVRDKDQRAIDPPKIINLDIFRTDENKHKYEISRVVQADDYVIDLRNYILREMPLQTTA
jgi:putative nucleotidyltransferase with HDIG domain